MSERKPDYWVVKKGDVYHSPPTSNPKRLFAYKYTSKSDAEHVAVNGWKAVPVYVTVKKIKKGHSWSWACKRLLEGKKVKQSFWSTGNYLYVGSDTVTVMIRKEDIDIGALYKVAAMKLPELAAKNWELYDE